MRQSILVIFFTLYVFSAQGQTVKSIGIKGGLSIANQPWQYKTINFTPQGYYKTGIYSVLTLELFQHKYLSLLTDLGFIQKGNQIEIEVTTTENPDGGTLTKLKSTINYFTFSPLLKFRYDIKRWTPYVFVGPRIDYQLSYQSEFSSAIGNEFNKSILGITYGAGVEFRQNKIGMLMEFQHQPDITSVMDKPISSTNTGLKITNNAFVISAGIKYYFH
jgi:hypothetical protein